MLSATPGPEEQWIWDLYQQEQTAYALRVPQMVTIGNHEQFANATAFANRYRMATGGGGVPPFYYSYNVGPVHIVAFTTDGPPGYAAGSPQLAWLASDLAAVDRSVTPWVVFTTHRPLYCSAIMEFGEHADEAKVIEPLLLAGKVDLVVTGHVHVYEVCRFVSFFVVIAHFFPPVTAHSAKHWREAGRVQRDKRVSRSGSSGVRGAGHRRMPAGLVAQRVGGASGSLEFGAKQSTLWLCADDCKCHALALRIQTGERQLYL